MPREPTLTPDRLAAQAAYAIDWVDRFDGPDAYAKRRPRPPATWQQLQADIEDIPARLGAASHVAITGSLRLAPAFIVGAAQDRDAEHQAERILCRHGKESDSHAAGPAR